MALELTAREMEQAAAYPECLAELRLGHPRRFVEEFCYILDGDTRQIVPMRYTETQEILDEQEFQPLKSWLDPVRLNVLKARQVRMSSISFAVTYAVAVNIPNVEAIYVFQDDRTGKDASERLDTFERRMPAWFFYTKDVGVSRGVGEGAERVTIEEKADDKRRYGFWRLKGGVWALEGTSGITIVSAGSKRFGAGPKYNIAIYDEYDEYPDLRIVKEVNAALAADSAWVLKVTNPRGMRYMYSDYTEVKEGRGIGHNIVFYCFMNRSNRIPAGSAAAAPRVVGDFQYSQEHLAIQQSPEWREHSLFREEQDTKDFFRWYETKMQDTRQQLLAEKGIRDEKRVRAEFFSQFMVDDRTCWATYGVTPFDPDVITESHNRSHAVRPREKDVAPGLTYRQWTSPQSGMVYCCSMDSSLGRTEGADAISASIWDASGQQVASFYGRADLLVATREIVKVLKEYGTVMEPLLVPEVDGKFGLLVVQEAKRNGYSNVWYQPPKPGELPDIHSLKQREYGWRTQGNKEDMIQRGVAHFNNKDCMVWDMDLLRDMSTFDPTTQTHVSDRLMDFFVGQSVMDGNHPKGYGRQWAAMCARVKLGPQRAVAAMSGFKTDSQGRVILPVTGSMLARR